MIIDDVQQRLMTSIYNLLDASNDPVSLMDAHQQSSLITQSSASSSTTTLSPNNGVSSSSSVSGKGSDNDNGGAMIGIFESPTGTGKSLSLICSTLYWLLDCWPSRARQRALLRLQTQDAKSSSSNHTASSTSWQPSWVLEFSANGVMRDHEAREARFVTMRHRLNHLTDRADARAKRLRLIAEAKKLLSSSANDGHSDGDGRGNNNRSNKRGHGNNDSMMDHNGITDGGTLNFTSTGARRSDKEIASITRAQQADDKASSRDPHQDDELLVDWVEESEPTWKRLMRAEREEALLGLRRAYVGHDDVDDDTNNDDTITCDTPPQIIYCSRTHSQLAQFVHEIHRTVYRHRVRVVSLGSRINLCVNPQVRALGSALRMNDRCLDLLQQKEKKSDNGDNDNNDTNDKHKKRSKHVGMTSTGKCPYLEAESQTYMRY